MFSPAANYNGDYIGVIRRKDEWGEKDFKGYMIYLQDTYSFHITNPSYEEGIGVGLWYSDGNGNYPIIHWDDTDNKWFHFSANSDFGTQPIEPTKSFFVLVAFGVKEAEHFGLEKFNEDERIGIVISSMIADGYKYRFHEAMVANDLVNWICSDETANHSELEPITNFIDHCSVEEISRMVLD